MSNSPQKPDHKDYISVSIIEDNRYIREAWKAAIETSPNLVLIGAFQSCEQAFESDAIAGSDVVIMDIGLPGISGSEGVRYLKEKYPHIATVMCTVHDDDQNVFDTICNGAVGYLVKKVSPEEFKNAILAAAEGGSPMSPNIARKVIAAFQRPVASAGKLGYEPLTEKEQQVLSELAKGKSYKEVGQTFFLSVDGVRYYIRSIYEKLQVKTRAEAVAKGFKERIIR